jgi:uncharacterized OB-fold protein
VTSGVERPAPILTDDNRLFWEAAQQGRLITQRCSGCGRLRHPPRPMCPSCHSLEYDVLELAGTGVVYSYTILHHPQHPSFRYPVIAALVDLDEGVRVLSNLIDIAPSEVRIGLPVTVSFESTRDDLAVPVFAPAGDGR